MTFKDFASLAFLTAKWCVRNPRAALLVLADCAIEADEVAFVERVMAEAEATPRVVVVRLGEGGKWSVN